MKAQTDGRINEEMSGGFWWVLTLLWRERRCQGGRQLLKWIKQHHFLLRSSVIPFPLNCLSDRCRLSFHQLLLTNCKLWPWRIMFSPRASDVCHCWIVCVVSLRLTSYTSIGHPREIWRWHWQPERFWAQRFKSLYGLRETDGIFPVRRSLDASFRRDFNTWDFKCSLFLNIAPDLGDCGSPTKTAGDDNDYYILLSSCSKLLRFE